MTPEFEKELLSFLNHPWQEDKEIEFVELASEYYNKGYYRAGDGTWRLYLKGLYHENEQQVILSATDSFMEKLELLIGKERTK